MANVRRTVQLRSNNQCEAVIRLMPRDSTPVHTRCGLSPVEIHHRLLRSRGGLILDDAGEDYHLLALCRKHHKHAHEDPYSTEAGLMITGYVITRNGRPLYTGQDWYLTKRWGPDEQQPSG